MISLGNFKYPGDMAVPGKRIGRFERSQGDLMKKLIMTALTGLVLVALATPVLALGPLDANAGLGLHSKYVWRGMVVTPDMVLQPEVSVGLLGFTAGFWGNMDTNDINGQESEFNEIDWTLGYEMGLPFMNFGAGFIYYTFPNSLVDMKSTTEFYLNGSLNVLLSPSLTFYQDLDQIKGAYWEASVSHGMPLSPAANLDLGAGLGLGSKGYIEGYFGPATILPSVPEVPGNATMTDAYLTASVPYSLALFFTITPSVTYTTLLSDVKDIVDAADGVAYHGESDAFYWSLTGTFKF